MIVYCSYFQQKRHLHYDASNSTKTKTSPPFYETASKTSLGNKIVSLLQCLGKELLFSGRFYHNKVKELKKAIPAIGKWTINYTIIGFVIACLRC